MQFKNDYTYSSATPLHRNNNTDTSYDNALLKHDTDTCYDNALLEQSNQLTVRNFFRSFPDAISRRTEKP
jgi:hypothetical protein